MSLCCSYVAQQEMKEVGGWPRQPCVQPQKTFTRVAGGTGNRSTAAIDLKGAPFKRSLSGDFPCLTPSPQGVICLRRLVHKSLKTNDA